MSVEVVRSSYETGYNANRICWWIKYGVRNWKRTQMICRFIWPEQMLWIMFCFWLKQINLREEDVWKRESNFGCFSLRSLFDIQVDMLIGRLKFEGKFSDGNKLWASSGLSDVYWKLRDWQRLPKRGSVIKKIPRTQPWNTSVTRV